uniref:Uncharacterized protein n=1 Tax=Oryza punctata TaxID=4537 RepID=A0A0E0LZN3_ORYPU
MGEVKLKNSNLEQNPGIMKDPTDVATKYMHQAAEFEEKNQTTTQSEEEREKRTKFEVRQKSTGSDAISKKSNMKRHSKETTNAGSDASSKKANIKRNSKETTNTGSYDVQRGSKKPNIKRHNKQSTETGGSRKFSRTFRATSLINLARLRSHSSSTARKKAAASGSRPQIKRNNIKSLVLRKTMADAKMNKVPRTPVALNTTF